ncbi:MAG: recombinase family protein [Anaerolineaceae bacterium]|nr:recombinase family protein [Anaerolineaceae bacterium]
MNERSNTPGWATYLRVSDEDKQTPERSFAMQRQHIQEQLLAPSNLILKREYCDMLTGTTPNRKDYQQMLVDAESGLFSHLGLYRADRFGRNTVEGLQAATRLIGIGIKIRVAHMPSLRPEEPDGFFMFLIQMGMAQREVDVLRQRTRDGTEVKFRSGFWPNKAPEGYMNKERQIKSGKYERWVEQDPIHCEGLRIAWGLLLADRYTLDQICEELARLGYNRSNGQPWAWNDPTTGKRRNARSNLHNIFHNPFYAGWAVSQSFGIAYGEIRGQWDPLISTTEYEKGIEVLRKHDDQKSRIKKQFYLLRNLLWVNLDGKFYKLYGTTPTGRSKSYSYYATQTKGTNEKNLHVPCGIVDNQIPDWLSGIMVDHQLIPAIREIYKNQVKQATQEDREVKLSDLKRRISLLREEEARLGRLLITGKISETTFDQLRIEWQEKLRNTEISLAEMERETTVHMDDLDLSLILLSRIAILYNRLSQKDKIILLQILAKRIIVDPQGNIIDHELNSPFVYLKTLAAGCEDLGKEGRGSDHVQHRLLKRHLKGCFFL